MALIFSDLANEVYAQCGLDSGDTTNQANVTRWLNFSQNDFCARWPWPWLYSRESFVSVPDYVTGTVNVVAGSTTVTGIGTTWTTTHQDQTYFIQFSSANDWYFVASVNTGAQTLVIDKAYVQPSGNGLTYIIRKFFYNLGTNVDEIIDIRNWDTPVKLIQVDTRFIDQLNPLVQSTNAPYAYMINNYALTGTSLEGNVVISPYPFPSDARLFEVRKKNKPADGLVSVPSKYVHVIAWGATAIGFAYLRQVDMAAAWSKKFEERIAQIKTEFRFTEDFQPVFKSIDSVQRSKWISLPDSYPVIQSG